MQYHKHKWLIEPLQSQLLQDFMSGLDKNKVVQLFHKINDLEKLNLNHDEINDKIIEHSNGYDFNIILKYISIFIWAASQH